MTFWKAAFLCGSVAVLCANCNKTNNTNDNDLGGTDLSVLPDLDGGQNDAAPGDGNPGEDMAQTLSLISASPPTGPSTGNIDITLTGTGFGSGATVTIDGLNATVRSGNATTLVVSLPTRLGGKGLVPVVVRNPSGQTISSSTIFAYYFGTLQFDPAAKTTVGGTPNAIAATELENNAKLDLVVTDNSLAGQVITLSGNGNGVFLTPGKFASGAYAYGLRVLDFDGDGWNDVLVANSGSAPSGIGLHLNSKTGTFPARQVVVSGDLPLSVDAGDLNGDGLKDLVVANGGGASNNVTVHLGKAGGLFEAPVTLAAGGIPRSVILADLNKDGKLDLAVANEQTANVSVFIGDGKGAFGAKTDYLVGSGPYALAATDFTLDGILDLVVCNYRGASLSLLPGVGNGTFNPQKTTSIGTAVSSFPTSIAIGDMNGDGRPDVASAIYADQQVGITYNANGLFGTTTKLLAGAFPRGVAVGDFNGDGKNDLATANSSDGTVSILLNQSQ